MHANGVLIMNQIEFLPPESPLHYWRLVRAVYKNARNGMGPADYVNKKQPITPMIEPREKVNEWRICLFQNTETSELIVSFRGTKNFDNWVDNTRLFLDVAHELVEKIEKIVEKWKQKHGEISAYVGHSAGGYFATHVFKHHSDVFRITWNGFRCKQGPRTINLRTTKDPLTGDPLLGCDLSRYITVCKGKHKIMDFKEFHKRNNDWQAIFPPHVYQNLVVATPSVLPPINNYSKDPATNSKQTSTNNQSAPTQNVPASPGVAGPAGLAESIQLAAKNYLPPMMLGGSASWAIAQTETSLRSHVHPDAMVPSEETSQFNAIVSAVEGATMAGVFKMLGSSSSTALAASIGVETVICLKRAFYDKDEEVVQRRNLFGVIPLSK